MRPTPDASASGSGSRARAARLTAAALCALAVAAAPVDATEIDPAPERADASVTAGDPAAAAQPLRLSIEAPPEVLALLQEHLDLARAGRLTREDIDDGEWDRLVEAAPSQVRELLQTEGYFAPSVALRRTAGGVTLSVAPGNRARVREVSLQAVGALQDGVAAQDPHASTTLQLWRRDWTLREDTEFRNLLWSEAKAEALARLRAAGYAAAAWRRTEARVEPGGLVVRLRLEVDSGPLFRFGGLDIEGLVRHDAITVGQLAAMVRGAPVTEARLLDFQERLQKSALFDSISVTLDTDAQRADAARVQVRLRESPLQQVTLGVGVSANTGARASLEHVYRRVLGYPAASTLRLEVGQRRELMEAELGTHPGRNLTRWLLGASVERLSSDADQVLSQRLRLGQGRDATRREDLTFVEAERSVRRPDDGTRRNAVGLSLNYHGSWRELDSLLLPTDGQTLAVQVGVGRSHGTDAERGTFSRAYGRWVLYRALGGRWYGQSRIELGRVFQPPGTVVPESQKWRAGGDDSVRGYGYRSLGPLDGSTVGSGTALATASLEVARPISPDLPSLWWAGFVDAGQAADRWADLQPVVGLGLGVRWRSPVGPLRLDWAWGQASRKSRLHFSVGIVL